MPVNRAFEPPVINCCVTRLTPPGRSAVATVSVEGPTAVQIVMGFFQPFGRQSLKTVPIDRILVGQWRSQSGCSEEVVIARRGTSRWEIHCHGGLAASEAIIQSLTRAGAQAGTTDDWLTLRVAEPIQRAAWQALTEVSTERAAGILLDQLRGALPSAIREMIALLQGGPGALDDVAQRFDRLIQLGSIGVHLTQPWSVAFAGPPNVGKSRLMNAIVGYERSIVFDQPGTTRDVLGALTALDGWPVELFDTAGFRESSDLVEREGTRRARRQLEDADLAIIVLDFLQLNAPFLRQFQAAARRSLVVVNKSDLVDGTPELPSEWLWTSARTGAGIQELISRIVRTLVPLTPQRGEAVPFTQEQGQLLRAAQCSVLARDSLAAMGILSRLLEESSSAVTM